ncbi:MAG: hypothetical protein U9Q66_02195 [Patescibacteria group bacterium]|nr:hypothetical protein [Patescibacteria group bacterium]
MNRINSAILEQVNLQKGKTLEELGEIKVGEVWGRSDDYWVILEVDIENDLIVTFTNNPRSNSSKKNEDSSYTEKYSAVKKYFLMSPMEITYSTITDDKIINRVYFEKKIKNPANVDNDLENIINNMDTDDYLDDLLKIENKLIDEENSSTLNELFCKAVYTNGKDKLFFAFYNTDEIISIDKLMFEPNFFERFGINIVKQKVHDIKYTLEKDIAGFIDNSLIIKSFEKKEGFANLPLTDTHKIIFVTPEFKVMLPKIVTTSLDFYKEKLIYHSINGKTKMYILSNDVVNEYVKF